MTINEKILRLRKARSLTQAELGEKLGVTDKAVSKWEQGNGMPDLEQIQSLSDFFNVSLDYLLKDVARTTGDYQAQHDMEEEEKKTETKGKNDELRDKCKKYLEEQGIADFDEKILPFVEDDGKTINNGCFDIEGDQISLSFEKLKEYKQPDLIRKFFADQITPADAIALDDVQLLKEALKDSQRLSSERNSLIKGYSWVDGSPEISDYERYQSINLDSLLENLDSKLKNFYYFVVMLIDAGAKYYKQVGEGDDITVFRKVEDTSRTNFFYRIAKDKIQ